MPRQQKKLTELSKDVIDYFVERSRVSQQRIADILQVDKSFVSRVRGGARELSTNHLQNLADHLGVEVGVMLIDATRPRKPVSAETQKLLNLCEKLIRMADAATSSLNESVPVKRAS